MSLMASWLSDRERAAVCWDVAVALCKDASLYVAKIKRSAETPLFIRAIFRCNSDEIKVDRVLECPFTRYGDILAQSLLRTTKNLDSTTCAPCWLTLLSSDGEIALQHAFFAMVIDSKEPIGLETVFSMTTNRTANVSFSSSAPPHMPPPDTAVAGHIYEIAAMDNSELSSPSIAGRSHPPPVIPRPSEVDEQSSIERRNANAFCALSCSLPRLQPSAPYKPHREPDFVSRPSSRQLVVYTSLEDTVLVEPSLYAHQVPDEARRDRFSPQREDLWHLAEKSMTRFTGIQLLEDSY